MTKYTVLLNSIEKIKNFVNTITRYPYDFDLVSGRYTMTPNPLWVSFPWI